MLFLTVNLPQTLVHYILIRIMDNDKLGYIKIR